MVQRWKEGASRKICLAVDDETELEYFLGLVQEASLPFALFRDAGLTEVAPGTVTVLGIGPAPRHTMDSLLRELKAYE
jgi:PTH2 family peptidyl-tRNA hydrolase